MERTIREDHLFTASRVVVQSNARRFDEQVEGAIWVIARDAEKCARIPHTSDLRIIKTDPYPDAPALRIYFTIDDADHCTLRYVERVPVEDELEEPQF